MLAKYPSLPLGSCAILADSGRFSNETRESYPIVLSESTLLTNLVPSYS
ncbi:MAG: hypothetical protein KKF48_01065 [Nanoarchaeota archaeon]|nr:hypothetical protein [Nanoarchaeota archaeon]MBU1027613.1 hypothetical protein [Nanoarchaeota archaeon]